MFYIGKLKIIHTFTTSFIINKLTETIKELAHFSGNKLNNAVPFKYINVCLV